MFDRELKRRQRDWAASRPDAASFDYLRAEVSQRLVDRIEDIQRSFPLALDVSCHTGHVFAALSAHEGLGGEGGIGGVKTLIMGDASEHCARKAMELAQSSPHAQGGRLKGLTLVMDEEHLPFPDATFDLVTSSLGLHWVNDLPAALKEARRVLKPDGCFIGAMLGGATLNELRESFVMAETEREGGVSPRVSPMASASDAGGLLTQAGFTLPTVDVDTVVCEYSDAFMVMDELQGMGEQSASLLRRSWGQRPAGRDTFLAAASLYHCGSLGRAPLAGERSQEAAADTPNSDLSQVTVPASFQVIYMIGWAPHESQPIPDERGSATRSFAEIPVTKTPAPLK